MININGVIRDQIRTVLILFTKSIIVGLVQFRLHIERTLFLILFTAIETTQPGLDSFMNGLKRRIKVITQPSGK
jgi:hypothetical protein